MKSHVSLIIIASLTPAYALCMDTKVNPLNFTTRTNLQLTDTKEQKKKLEYNMNHKTTTSVTTRPQSPFENKQNLVPSYTPKALKKNTTKWSKKAYDKTLFILDNFIQQKPPSFKTNNNNETLKKICDTTYGILKPLGIKEPTVTLQSDSYDIAYQIYLMNFNAAPSVEKIAVKNRVKLMKLVNNTNQLA